MKRCIVFTIILTFTGLLALLPIPVQSGHVTYDLPYKTMTEVAKDVTNVRHGQCNTVSAVLGLINKDQGDTYGYYLGANGRILFMVFFRGSESADRVGVGVVQDDKIRISQWHTVDEIQGVFPGGPCDYLDGMVS